jgi:hypothetical protein
MPAKVPAAPRQAPGLEDATAVLVEETMSLLIKRYVDLLLALKIPFLKTFIQQSFEVGRL